MTTKIAFILSMILLLNLSATVYSQKTKFTVDLRGKTVREVFQVLEQQSKFRFFYNDEFSYIDKVVNLNIQNENVEQILEKLFASSDITYKILDNNLVVLTLKQNFQNNAITGKVNEGGTGEVLPGVNVSIKGTSRGTITDIDGNYSIEVESGEILVFSYVGYINEEVTIREQTVINITLQPDIKSLQEIVVIGYGVQKKSSVTGSISPVSSKDINELPVASIQSALQGRAAGVSVVNQGGPGTEPIVRIRGNGSISYASTPLYVVDGFPTSEIISFDAQDIESIEILKDASATAIYGSRGANGVILITTKKGKKDGKVYINVDAYTGVQSLPNKIDLLNTEQYVTYARGFNNGVLPDRVLNHFNDPIYEGAAQTFAQTNTDWQDALFQNAGLREVNMSLSMSNDRSTFYGSAGYFDQEGIMIGTGYQRLNFRFNSEHNVTKSIKFGQTLFYSTSDRENEKRTQGRSNIMHALRQLPYMPIYDPTKEGGFVAADNSDGSDPDNPIKIQELWRSNSLVNKLFGTIYVEVALTDFLMFKSTAGLDNTVVLNKTGEPIYNDGFNEITAATSRRQNLTTKSRLFTNQLTFHEEWGKHDVNITAVAEQQSTSRNVMFIGGTLPTNLVSELTGLGNVTANGSLGENLLLSYLGRINYGFGDKYLFSLAIRADGSSKFGPGNKWGYFPSASVGWRIDQEPFLQNSNLISQLKIRGGYGSVGNNNNIGNYDWQAVILANTQYVLNNNLVDGSYFNAIPNEDLKWETSKMTNIGVDLGLFENKVTLTADYFTKMTENLILDVPLALSMGITAPYFANVGEMRNNGVEFELGFRIDGTNLKSTLSGNVSIIKNKVLNLATPTATIDRGQHPDFGGFDVTRTVAGMPIQTFYGWKTDGIFQNQEQIDASAVQVVGTNPSNSTSPGDIKFKDISGPNGVPDGIIDAYDRTFLGSYLPDFTFGLNYTGTYKNFDFSVFFQGSQGNKIYNGTKVITQGMIRLFNASPEVLNAWRPDNRDTSVPRLMPQDPNANARTSDRFIEDGSYIRLKSLTIGYSLPKNLINSVSWGTLSSARIYVSGQNLLTFTKYSGYDPEVGVQVPIGTDGIPNASTTERDILLRNGIDYGLTPSPRSILGGIQFNF